MWLSVGLFGWWSNSFGLPVIGGRNIECNRMRNFIKVVLMAFRQYCYYDHDTIMGRLLDKSWMH